MLEAIAGMFDASDFMPHGHCFLWTPALLWSYVVSDTVIGLSYFSIPFSLWYVARWRPDLPFRWVFLLFALFVLACGTTHLLAVWNIWHAGYWLDAGVKSITAAASVATALILWRLMPNILAIPSRTQLVQANLDLRDEISRRLVVEDDLRKANALLGSRTTELEAANRELDSFAYAVSHDLRAPLRAVRGFSRAMIEDHGDTLAPEARDYLVEIDRGGELMGKLIDGLLALSRSVRMEIRGEAIDVSALAEGIRDELARAEPSRTVAWRIEPGLTVRGDGRLVETVMRNLLANAWKYTGGATAPEIRVESGAEDGEPCVRVSDNGAGFDMKHADRLFKPFQRLHRQDEFPGIGIGLATVARIVRRHGGWIRAEGAVGRGATFRFSLLPATGTEDPGS